MTKRIKKGFIIGGTAIAIAVSSVAGGYFLAERIFGHMQLISAKDKEKQIEEQQNKEIQADIAREENIQALQKLHIDEPVQVIGSGK
jgi:hypothetical protein